MNNTISTTFQNIKQFVSEFAGVPEISIMMNSGLENDLKIYGDDSFDLIIAYSKKFNVDISNFNFKNYIAPEGDTLLPLMVDFFNKSNNKKRIDLKISDLVDGVILGRLDETTIK